MRILTQAPINGFPSILGGRTRNCQAASRIARARPEPGGESPSVRQSSTWNRSTVRHAIMPRGQVIGQLGIGRLAVPFGIVEPRPAGTFARPVGGSAVLPMPRYPLSRLRLSLGYAGMDLPEIEMFEPGNEERDRRRRERRRFRLGLRGCFAGLSGFPDNWHAPGHLRRVRQQLECDRVPLLAPAPLIGRELQQHQQKQQVNEQRQRQGIGAPPERATIGFRRVGICRRHRRFA